METDGPKKINNRSTIQARWGGDADSSMFKAINFQISQVTHGRLVTSKATAVR